MIDTYGNIAQAGYSDALTAAMELRDSVVQLTEVPSEKALTNAREAQVSVDEVLVMSRQERYPAGLAGT